MRGTTLASTEQSNVVESNKRKRELSEKERELKEQKRQVRNSASQGLRQLFSHPSIRSNKPRKTPSTNR